MKRIFTLCAVLLMAFGHTVNAQEENGLVYVGEAASMRMVPSLNSRAQLTPADVMTEEPQDGRHIRGVKANVVPGKDLQTEDDFLARNPHRLDKKINLNRSLELDFVVNNNVSAPSDPSLAVGPDHVYVVFNTGLIIYDKEGNDLTGPFNVNNIFSNGGCCDLTVSYDNLADRWVLTYLFSSGGLELAVSDGPDPTTANWFVYSFPQVSDYNKLSVWRDGYYITDNGSRDVWAIDRDAALAGDPAANIQGFAVPGVQGQGFTSAQVANITDDTHPTTGGAPLIYMRDDGFAGVTVDQVNIWTVNVDFDTPANSNVTAPEEFPVTPFINVFDGGSFANLQQPNNGDSIDALQSVIMNQAQFRKFATHNSMIFNFVLDLDAGAGKRAGIRWYEFRQDMDGGPWMMHQEGTHTSPDGRHAWNASMAMDGQGNIGMGYSSMAGPDTPNATDFPIGAYYTGRFASDPLGTMTIAEEVVAVGAGNLVGIPSRFGDYAKVDVDPNGNKEFWFVTEYRSTNHVAKFQIAGDFMDDLGIISVDSPEDGILTATEDVTVTIFNFGVNDASNFEVSYQIDGGATVTEMYTETLTGGGNSAQYTFATQADLSTEGQTYSITACASLTGDEDPNNDCITQDVKHLNTNDTGITALTSPVSGQSSDDEQVTVEITNFGGATQTDIPVYYTINGGAAIQEMYSGSIESGATDSYTFTATADLSEIGDYEIVAGTELAGDADETNDDLTSTVSNFICMPESNCAEFNDGVINLVLADQNINPECDGTSIGYTDNSDIIFNFVLDDNPFEGTLQMGWINSNYAIFIDFNDDNSFDSDELVAQGTAGAAETDFPFVIDFNDFANVANGMHRMRVRGADQNNGSGNVTEACGDLQFGRTNDFTANISGMLLGLNDVDFGGTDLQINYLPNNQFEVVFENNTSFNERLPITVYNTVGQKLAYYTIENTGSAYRKTIDMSYVAAGVYFVQVGDETLNKTKKIIVN